MPTYTVEMTRHIISYRKAVAHDIVADNAEAAAKIAVKLSLEWLEDDEIDEGSIDFEVSSETEGTIGWRDDA